LFHGPSQRQRGGGLVSEKDAIIANSLGEFAQTVGEKSQSEPGRAPESGDRYDYPPNVREGLEEIFGEGTTEGIEIIYRPWYVRLHGMERGSTTRPERIYTNLPPEEFFGDEFHLLHEHFHVIRQWRTGRMNRFNYLWEGLKEGRNNIWEREANDFAREHELELRDFLRRKP
jgi:hypothetical protein